MSCTSYSCSICNNEENLYGCCESCGEVICNKCFEKDSENYLHYVPFYFYFTIPLLTRSVFCEKTSHTEIEILDYQENLQNWILWYSE